MTNLLVIEFHTQKCKFLLEIAFLVSDAKKKNILWLKLAIIGDSQLTRERFMNKKILLGSAVALSAAMSFAADFDTWFGNMSVYQVSTGLDNGSAASGYWYSYDDHNDGGASLVTWPAPLGNDDSPDALDNVIDYCNGICGDITLNKGTLTYDPFMGFGFNVAGEDAKGKADPADASAWGGICIAYSAEAAPIIELGLGDAGDEAVAYDNPFIKLPKGDDMVKDIAWDEFNQNGWGVKDKGGLAITGPEASAKLGAIKVKFQSKDGTVAHFNIMSVGKLNGGCASTSSTVPGAVKGVRGASAAKAMLSGRTLSFAGVTSSATVEVISLQGQIMMKSSIDATSSLDLQSLQSGVYMVRVAGKSVDFTNKIVLK